MEDVVAVEKTMENVGFCDQQNKFVMNLRLTPK